MNIRDVKAAHDIVDVVRREGIVLEKKRAVWHGLCPMHKEDTPSFTVDPRTQRFRCYGCDQKGDVIDFITKLHGIGVKEAMSRIAGSATFEIPQRVAPAKKSPKWTPCPDGSAWENPSHYSLGVPDAVWTYRAANGGVIGHVGRFNLANGSKEVLPCTLATNGFRKEWRWMGMGVSRPLYNLDVLASRKESIVLLVEGEKTAEAAALLYPDFVATTWSGGGKSWRLTDLSPLKGRVVIYSPDNDMPGIMTMLEIAAHMSMDSKGYVMRPPSGAEKGWDLADYGGCDPLGHLKSCIDPLFFEACNPNLKPDGG